MSDFIESHSELSESNAYSGWSGIRLNTGFELVEENYYSYWLNITKTVFSMRGADTGAGFVYWQSTGVPDFYPGATMPALQGSLTNQAVISLRKTL